MLAAALLWQAAVPSVAAIARDRPADAPGEERFNGIWLDIFEGQQFVPGARVVPARIDPTVLPRLTIDRVAALRELSSAALARTRLIDMYSPHAYRISFIGHRNPVADCRALVPPRWGCIGTGGVMPYDITVTHVLSIADAGPLPR